MGVAVKREWIDVARRGQACREACLRCYAACLALACQHRVNAGGISDADTRLYMACADMCRATAHVLLLGGTPDMAGDCADLCDRCAEIEADDDVARLCRECAILCRDLNDNDVVRSVRPGPPAVTARV